MAFFLSAGQTLLYGGLGYQAEGRLPVPLRVRRVHRGVAVLLLDAPLAGWDHGGRQNGPGLAEQSPGTVAF